MASLVADIFVKSKDINGIRGMVQAAFDQNMFKVAWHDTYAGVATKGNKVLNILFGVICTYHEISFNVFQDPQQQIYVHLERRSSGWWGGLIGASMAKKRFRQVRDLLAAYFNGQGVLDHVAGD
jgi:hypothetical protein